MPVFLVEEEEIHEESGTTFAYERLRSQDREQLRYVLSTRGLFEQELYERAVITVCLRGWALLLGRGGREIVWPALEAGPAAPGVSGNGTPQAAIALLYPGVSPARQRQLATVLEVVSKFGSELHVTLYQKMNALEPEQLKKSWDASLRGGSGSPIAAPDASLPAEIAEASAGVMPSPSPATPEA